MSAAQRAELLEEMSRSADARSKAWLEIVILAASGPHTLEELAHRAGRSRSTIQVWIEKFTRGGVAGLLARDTPPGTCSPIGVSKIQAQMRAGLKSGRWRTAVQVAAWLKETHGIKRSRKSIYYWISKNRKNASSAAAKKPGSPKLAGR